MGIRERRTRRAFTLLEALVVAGIILLLAALLWPALSTAREYGRRATCLNNLRQLALGMTMFADTHDGQLPSFVYEFTARDASGTPYYELSINPLWSMAEVGLIANPDILRCPSDRNPAMLTMSDGHGGTRVVPVSYGYNFEYALAHLGIHHAAAAQTVLLFDGAPDAATSGFYVGVPADGQYAGLLDPSFVPLGQGNANPNGQSRWLVCHATGSADNPYITLLVANPSILNAHIAHGDSVAPCADHDLRRFNNLLLDRRHLRKANVLFLDGHGEWIPDLPADGL